VGGRKDEERKQQRKIEKNWSNRVRQERTWPGVLSCGYLHPTRSPCLNPANSMPRATGFSVPGRPGFCPPEPDLAQFKHQAISLTPPGRARGDPSPKSRVGSLHAKLGPKSLKSQVEVLGVGWSPARCPGIAESLEPGHSFCQVLTLHTGSKQHERNQRERGRQELDF
jgi:hypothetical protein